MRVSNRSSAGSVSLLRAAWRMSLLAGAMALSLGCVAELSDEAEAEQEVSALAIPAPPESISSTTSECYGWNRVDWSNSSGATYYELHRTYPSARLVYSGATSATSVNVGNQSANYHARACNSEGCSGFGPLVSVWPFPTCN